MGSALYLNWVCCCTLGAFAGALFCDPRRLGADFAFTALFIGLIAGFWKGRSTAATITASAVAAALAYVLVGPPWHVGIGALAGIMTAYFSASQKPP
jgi:predicted branched-subunit amino acid permease